MKHYIAPETSVLDYQAAEMLAVSAYDEKSTEPQLIRGKNDGWSSSNWSELDD